MDPKVNQKLTIGICLLFMILVSIFTYGYLDRENNEGEVLLEKNLKHSLDIYRGIDGNFCLGKSEECEINVMNVLVDSDAAKLIDVTYDGNYVLIDDNGLELYDVKNDIKNIINLDGYDECRIAYDTYKNKVVGIFYYKDKYIDEETLLEDYKIRGFYSILNNKKMYEDNYTSLILLDGKYIEGKKVILSNDGSEEITETSLLLTGEEKKVSSVNGVCEDYGIVLTGQGSYVKEVSSCENTKTTLYTENLSLIAEDLDNYEWSYDDNGNLYVLDGNQVKQYDKDGKIVKTSNQYGQIVQVTKDYIIYVDSGMLKITNENDVNLDVVSWNYGVSYDSDASGYRGELNGYPKEETGVYMNIYNDNVNSMYYFNEETKEISIVENN